MNEKFICANQLQFQFYFLSKALTLYFRLVERKTFYCTKFFVEAVHPFKRQPKIIFCQYFNTCKYDKSTIKIARKPSFNIFLCFFNVLSFIPVKRLHHAKYCQVTCVILEQFPTSYEYEITLLLTIYFHCQGEMHIFL